MRRLIPITFIQTTENSILHHTNFTYVEKLKRTVIAQHNINKSENGLLSHFLFTAHSQGKRALTKQDLSLPIIVSGPHLFSTLTSALLAERVFFFPSLIPLFTCDLFSRFSIPFLRCFGGFYEILQSILQSCRMPEVHTKSY